MKFGLRQIGITGMAIFTVFIATGCATSKVSQCASMNKIVNQTLNDTKDATKSGTDGGVPTIEKLVEIFAKAAKDLDSVNVSDAKLKTYKSQFLTMYQDATEINKQLITSIKERKSTKVHEALRKSQNIFSPERDLTTGVTKYCQEPEK